MKDKQLKRSQQQAILKQVQNRETEQQYNVQEITAMQEIGRFNEWNQSTADISPDKKVRMFHEERFVINEYNREEINPDGFHPQGAEFSRNSRIEGFEAGLASNLSLEGQEAYLRDNIHKMPPEMLPSVVPYYEKTQDELTSSARHIDRARNITGMDGLIARLDKEGGVFDPNTSVEAYTQTILRTMGAGLEQDVIIDPETGRLTVSGPDGNRHEASLIPSGKNIYQELDAQVDIAPRVREWVRGKLTKSRADSEASAKTANKAMYDNIEEFPEHMRQNILLDFAYDHPEDEQERVIREGLSKAILAKVRNGTSRKFRDIMSSYQIERDKVMSFVGERVGERFRETMNQKLQRMADEAEARVNRMAAEDEVKHPRASRPVRPALQALLSATTMEEAKKAFGPRIKEMMGPDAWGDDNYRADTTRTFIRNRLRDDFADRRIAESPDAEWLTKLKEQSFAPLQLGRKVR